jgi:hypothetical protein
VNGSLLTQGGEPCVLLTQGGEPCVLLTQGGEPCVLLAQGAEHQVLWAGLLVKPLCTQQHCAAALCWRSRISHPMIAGTWRQRTPLAHSPGGGGPLLKLLTGFVTARAPATTGVWFNHMDTKALSGSHGHSLDLMVTLWISWSLSGTRVHSLELMVTLWNSWSLSGTHGCAAWSTLFYLRSQATITSALHPPVPPPNTTPHMMIA